MFAVRMILCLTLTMLPLVVVAFFMGLVFLFPKVSKLFCSDLRFRG